MTDEMWALQRSQLGTQSALNTLVPATVRLVSMMIDDTDVPSMHEYGPQGELFDTLEEIGLESSTFKLSGVLDYNEALYLFTNMFGTPATSTPVGGTDSRKHIWTPPVDDVWTPKPMSLERGSTSGRARTYADFIIKTLAFDHGMDKYDPSGDAFGNPVTTGASLTSSLAAVGPQVPVKGEQTNVYLDSTNQFSGSPTQLTRYFEHKYSIADAFAPEYPGTRSTNGFTTFAQLKPKATGTLTMEADSVGEGIFADIRAGSIMYLRVDSLGPIIEGSIHYQLTVDMAIKFSTPSAYKNVSDFSGLDWNYKMVKDPAWTSVNASGQALQITLVNKVAAVL